MSAHEEMGERVRQVAATIRSRLPRPPAGMDTRVLTAIERDRRARAARRRRASRAPLPPRLVRALVAGALAVAVAAGVHAGLQRTEGVAIAVGPLTADCRRAAGGSEAARDDRLVVAGVWSGPELKRFTGVLARFERETGIDVSFAYETRTIAPKLESRIKRGCPPHVAMLPQPGLMVNLAHRGLLHPLDDVAGDVVARNYGRAWRELATVDGRMFGIWFKASNKSTVWYRRGALAVAGVTRPPRTWDELLRAARRLRDAGVRPFSVAGASPWTLTDWFENVYLRTAGPQRYRQLAEHRIPWTHPTVLRALRLLGRLLGDRGLVGPPAAMLETTFEESVADVFGSRRSAAMVYEADFVRSYVPDGAVPGAGFFAFPAMGSTGSAPMVVGGDVATMLRDTPAARRFLRFLATPAAAEPWARAGGFVTPNRALLLDVYPDELARRSAAALVDARTVEFDLSDLQPPAFGGTDGQGLWETFQDYLRSPTALDAITRRLEAAAQAARSCEQALRGRC